MTRLFRSIGFRIAAIAVGVFGAGVWVTVAEEPVQEARPVTPTVVEHAIFTPELAARYPSCIDQGDYRGPDHFIPATVLVQNYWRGGGAVRPMRLDRALAHNQNQSTRDDVWLVASCRGGIR